MGRMWPNTGEIVAGQADRGRALADGRPRRGRRDTRAAVVRTLLMAIRPLVVGLMILLAAPALMPAVVDARADAAEPRATAAVVSADGPRTVLTLDLSAPLKADVFTLADPWRVVVELPAVVFALPPETGERGLGLVRAFRFGAFAAGRARVVIDTIVPVAVEAVRTTPTATGAQLRLVLRESDAATFGSGTGAGRSSPPRAAALPAARGGPAGPAPAARAKPLIVIDPGHGGVDPGAIGSGKTMEKTIVLAVALKLRDALAAKGQYQVQLTRLTDVFVSLDKRVALSEDAGADLFLSLHADALEDPVMGKTAQGASIYTLSDRASDEQARTMAEKENAADLVAGVGQRRAAASDEVMGILSDLMARETSSFSHLASRSIVGSMSKIAALSRQPERSAAFRVLKQTRTPAVLIELGYLSNPVEEARMAAPAWQQQVAAAIATAVDAYFRRRTTSPATAPVPSLGGQRP